RHPSRQSVIRAPGILRPRHSAPAQRPCRQSSALSAAKQHQQQQSETSTDSGFDAAANGASGAGLPLLMKRRCLVVYFYRHRVDFRVFNNRQQAAAVPRTNPSAGFAPYLEGFLLRHCQRLEPTCPFRAQQQNSNVTPGVFGCTLEDLMLQQRQRGFPNLSSHFLRLFAEPNVASVTGIDAGGLALLIGALPAQESRVDSTVSEPSRGKWIHGGVYKCQTPSCKRCWLRKAKELFDVCDIEQKGFITKRDMQRLSGVLPLDPDQIEDVFDRLDDDGNGYLTLEEFTVASWRRRRHRRGGGGRGGWRVIEEDAAVGGLSAKWVMTTATRVEEDEHFHQRWRSWESPACFRSEFGL
uniref:EF-hand domain-containing protein n=1 Tax=Macrostomum lignano TaxID=282301 RepID=A0A1I8FEP0_9PLAT